MSCSADKEIGDRLPIEQCCVCPRKLTAFIYRDWWSVHGRCEYDLRDLRRPLTTPASQRARTRLGHPPLLL